MPGRGQEFSRCDERGSRTVTSTTCYNAGMTLYEEGSDLPPNTCQIFVPIGELVQGDVVVDGPQVLRTVVESVVNLAARTVIILFGDGTYRKWPADEKVLIVRPLPFVQQLGLTAFTKPVLVGAIDHALTTLPKAQGGYVRDVLLQLRSTLIGG